MQKRLGRFHGLLTVPAKPPTNWDKLALHLRQQTVVGPMPLSELLAGRWCLQNNGRSDATSAAADCQRLTGELAQAYAELCN